MTQTNQPSQAIDTATHTRLLTSVAEQLRVLLLQVARASELAETSTPSPEQLRAMRQASQFGLTLVDHYLLGLQYHDQQVELLLEPVSLANLLSEVAHELYPMASQYHTDVELHIAGKYPPIIADRAALKAALVSLSHSIITSCTTTDTRRLVQLAAHRIPRGMVAGVYSDISVLQTADLQRGRLLYGKAAQPITGIAPATSAGIFVADSLLQALGTSLRASKYQKRQGLGATFDLSGQLQLV